MTAPGWFQDPTSPLQLRYWDGSAWTEHVSALPPPSTPAYTVAAPATTPVQQVASVATMAPVGHASNAGAQPAAPASVLPAHADAGPVEPWPAWLVASIPILSLFIALGFSSSNPVIAYNSGWIALILNTLVCVWDARGVKKAGYGDLTGWAVFLIPVYLYKRQQRVGQSMAPWVVWLLTFAAAIAVTAVVLPRTLGVPIDTAKVESGITSWIEQKSGISVDQIHVKCPDNVSPQIGQTFDCVATFTDGTSATVTVTVTNGNGDVTWVAAP